MVSRQLGLALLDQEKRPSLVLQAVGVQRDVDDLVEALLDEETNIIVLHGAEMRTERDFNLVCSAAFQFPHWYGRNAMALFDLLEELPTPKRGGLLVVVSDADRVLEQERDFRRRGYLEALADVRRSWLGYPDARTPRVPSKPFLIVIVTGSPAPELTAEWMQAGADIEISSSFRNTFGLGDRPDHNPVTVAFEALAMAEGFRAMDSEGPLWRTLPRTEQWVQLTPVVPELAYSVSGGARYARLDQVGHLETNEADISFSIATPHTDPSLDLRIEQDEVERLNGVRDVFETLLRRLAQAVDPPRDPSEGVAGVEISARLRDWIRAGARGL